MLEIKLEGYDEVIRELRELQGRACELDGEHDVPFEELLTADFMFKHTRFSNVDMMLGESPWSMESTENFEAIPNAERDNYVSENTEFSGWAEMQQAAAERWAAKKLVL